MRLGLDSYSFHIALAAGTYDLFRTLDWMESLGLAGMQININGPNGRFLGGNPADKAHVRRVRQAFARKGFFTEVGGMGTSLEAVEWQLNLCAELGAQVFRTLLIFRQNPEETFRQTMHDLEQVLPLARKLGVRIALENHEDVTAEELRFCVAQMADPFLGVCLDSGNDLVLGGDPVRAAVELAPFAFTTHIKDQKLVRCAGTVYSVGVPLGTGDVDLPGVLAAIRNRSSVQRILIQETFGYASPLNPFQRADLPPLPCHDGVPAYESPAALRAARLFLSLDGLPPDELRAQAIAEEAAIVQDVTRIRAWLETTNPKPEAL